MKKTVKAWAVLDTASGALMRYPETGEYAARSRKYERKELHETFGCVPITITYEI